MNLKIQTFRKKFESQNVIAPIHRVSQPLPLAIQEGDNDSNDGTPMLYSASEKRFEALAVYGLYKVCFARIFRKSILL
jgi:hypothetical protein